MLKKLLFVTLMALPISCAGNSPAPVSPRPCLVPEAPPDPDINPFSCVVGDVSQVCLTEEDTVKLSTWIHGMQEVEAALARCSLVKRG